MRLFLRPMLARRGHSVLRTEQISRPEAAPHNPFVCSIVSPPSTDPQPVLLLDLAGDRIQVEPPAADARRELITIVTETVAPQLAQEISRRRTRVPAGTEARQQNLA